MAKNTSIVLGDHFERFVQSQVRSGRYHSASEVLRASLRLLEEQELRRERLRAALEAGEASGPAERINREDFLQRLRDGRAAGA